MNKSDNLIPIPKTNILLMLFLYGITLTLYEPIWYLCRIKFINSLNTRRKLDILFPVLLSVLILTQIGYSIIDFGPGAKLSWGLSWFFSVIVAFNVKNMIKEHLSSRITLSSGLSGFLTVLFRFFYLQYKINRQSEKIWC